MPNFIRRALALLGLAPQPPSRHQAEAAEPEQSTRDALAGLAARLDESIGRTEQAFAEAANSARSVQSRRQDALSDVDEWADKARQAQARRRSVLDSNRPDAEEAKRLDALVEDAVRRSVKAEALAAELEPIVEERTAQLAALKADLAALRRRREDLEDRRGELIARDSLAEAKSDAAGVLADLSEDGPTSGLARIESCVRSKEASAEGRAAVAASSDPDNAFAAELDSLMEDERTKDRIARIERGEP